MAVWEHIPVQNDGLKCKGDNGKDAGFEVGRKGWGVRVGDRGRMVHARSFVFAPLSFWDSRC